MASCCGDGNFCAFPWCDCDGNALFRKEHKMHTQSDEAQDCGNLGCNYCAQLIRKKDAAGASAPDSSPT